MYTVTSLAYDSSNRTLFYTADNAAYRDLVALDVDTKRQRTLLKDARIGELAFDRSDRSLWGIRVLNGICTLVQIAPPYSEWHAVYSWAYGETVYDLDVSPDGSLVSASVGEISGKQTLRVMGRASLLTGNARPVKQFDFGTAIPSNFTFSPDGKFLFGSSYYTGVSNIFRY
jgi:sugar lactone lactonase YvrE